MGGAYSRGPSDNEGAVEAAMPLIARNRAHRPVHWCACEPSQHSVVDMAQPYYCHRVSKSRPCKLPPDGPARAPLNAGVQLVCAGTLVTTTGALGQARYVLTANHW